MIKASFVVIALAVLTSSAVAQPGNTPPSEAEAPPAAGAPMPIDQPPPAGFDVDALVARAQAASPTLETVLRGTLRRARRAIAFGPTIGVWGGLVPGQDEQEAAITFGLGIETFKVPVMPTVESLKALVVERAKAKAKEQLIARFKGEQVDPVVAEQLVREIWEEAVQEILGLENIRPKTMERPALNVAIEVNRQLNLEGWTPRLRIGVGVWKVTLGASFGILLGEDVYPKTPVYTGVEIVTHFLTSKNPRSSVVDVFLRADFELRNRDTNSDQLVLGARYLFDLI